MISIVITTYNRCALVSRAIDSACTFCSRLTASEIVVVDDASQDETFSVIHNNYAKELREGHIRFFVNSTNLGVTGSKNRGYKEARGCWVGFLDSDDSLIPAASRKFAAILAEQNATPIIFFRCQTVDGKIVGKQFDGGKVLDLGCYVTHTSFGEAFTVVNKRMVQENPYPEELRGYEGLGCSRIIAKYGSAYLSDLVIRVYEKRGGKRLSGFFTKSLWSRLPLLARGHLIMLAEFWPAISLARKLKLVILSHVYEFLGLSYKKFFGDKKSRRSTPGDACV